MPLVHDFTNRLIRFTGREMYSWLCDEILVLLLR